MIGNAEPAAEVDIRDIMTSRSQFKHHLFDLLKRRLERIKIRYLTTNMNVNANNLNSRHIASFVVDAIGIIPGNAEFVF